jgi:uncharacterized membrane protein YvbJ
MALINCPDCGREVSERAPSCPQCGSPIAKGSVADPTTVHGRGEGLFMKSMNCGCMIALGFILLVVVVLVFALGSGT